MWDGLGTLHTVSQDTRGLELGQWHRSVTIATLEAKAGGIHV